MSVIQKIAKELKTVGLTDQQVAKVTQILSDNLPSHVYVIAVWFIGLITAALVIGALALMAKSTSNMEPVWVAVGAGLGALAGIFASKK